MKTNEQLMKACQIGCNNLNDANNLLAECYGRIGKIAEENERLRKDAERFNWIALNAKEQLAPESLHGEFAEHKTMYVLPKLIAWADFCGNIPFTEAVDYAIDAARGAK